MLTEEMIDTLIERAKEAAANAYCPYSDYPVGAAVLTEDGEIYVGCNVENLSFGATVCAERVAICNAVSNGYTKFEALAVYHEGEDLPYPCGICRQFLSEFGLDSDVVVSNGETYEVFGLSSMIPHKFDTKEI